MGLSVVTPPALDPISVAEAKAQCRIDLAEDDGSIAGYILAARQHAEDYLNRMLISQTLEYTIDYDWPCSERRQRIVLPRAPAAHPTSITYVDGAGVTQTLSSALYISANLDSGERVIEPAYGASWPHVRPQLATIAVRFVAGYGANPSDVPEPIRQALLLLVAHWYENREPVNIGNITTELPLTVVDLLYPHRMRLL